MPLRILCLHGQGVNAKIFEEQTKEMRQMLPPEYEFCFYDGEYECEPAPEVLDFFPPPYLTWYNTPTTQKVREAHGQGAAVAASLLLHGELHNQLPIFKAAVFIGSPVPFSFRSDVGIDVRQYFGLSGEPPNEHGRSTVIPNYLITDAAYLRSPEELERGASSVGVQYQMFHPSTDAVRIRVPTGHVYGSADKWYHHSKDLAGLCCEELRTVFEHDGGHEIPRAYTEELCDLVETVLSKIV